MIGQNGKNTIRKGFAHRLGTAVLLLGLILGQIRSLPAVELAATEVLVEPSALDFGIMDVECNVYREDVVRVTNQGSLPLILNATTITGDLDINYYAYTDDTPPITIQPGQGVNVNIIFYANTVGTKDALLHIFTQFDESQTQETTVTLTGGGIKPRLTVTPDALDFGMVNAGGGTGTPQTVTLNSTGETEVSFTPPGLSFTGDDAADFTLTPAADTTPIAAGASRPVAPSFSPTGIGIKNAKLHITTNAGDLPTTDVLLTGIGTHADLSVEPLALNFGRIDDRSGTTGPLAITLHNTGSTPISITGADFLGDGAGQFHLADALDSTPLAAGASRQVAVRFESHIQGLRQARLRLTTSLVPIDIALRAESSIASVLKARHLYVGCYDALYEMNLRTGVLTSLGGYDYPTYYPVNLVVEDDEWLIVEENSNIANLTGNRLLRVNRATREAQLFSDSVRTDQGISFTASTDLIRDPQTGTFYMASGNNILGIDPATGNRTLIYQLKSWTPMRALMPKLALEPDGRHLLVSDAAPTSLLRIDLTDHTTSTLSMPISLVTALAVDEAGTIFAACQTSNPADNVILRKDAGSEDWSPLAGSLVVGDWARDEFGGIFTVRNSTLLTFVNPVTGEKTPIQTTGSSYNPPKCLALGNNMRPRVRLNVGAPGLDRKVECYAGKARVGSPRASIIDGDDDQMTSLSARLLVRPDGAAETLIAGATLPAGITAAWNEAQSELCLSGPASRLDFETALRTIEYRNTASAPTRQARPITIKATDAWGDEGPAANCTVYIGEPADLEDTGTVPTGDSEPRDCGQTGVRTDFSENDTSGELVVELIGHAPSGLANALHKYWRIHGLEGTFAVLLSFGYTPAEIAAANLRENSLVLYCSEDGGLTWVEVPSARDLVNRLIRTQNPQTHFSLWALAGELVPVELSAFAAE